MSTEHRVPGALPALLRPAFKGTIPSTPPEIPSWLRVGVIVVAWNSGMPCKVKGIDGLRVETVSPAGRVRCVAYGRLRQATLYEKRQFEALVNLKQHTR